MALTGKRKLPRILTRKDLLSFSHCIFEPKIMNSVFPGFSFNLFAHNHFLKNRNAKERLKLPLHSNITLKRLNGYNRIAPER